MRGRFEVLLYLFFFTLIAGISRAWAAWEYRVYGGYNAAVEAWKNVSLIFSDAAFETLLTSAVVLGAIIVLYTTVLRAATGSRVDILRNWMVPVGIGMIVGSVFIFPKDSLVIYDEVLQRGPYQVDNVPKILAMTAGLTNKIERVFIDIVDTTAIDPSERYIYNAGGVGYDVLKKIHSVWDMEALSATKNYVFQTYQQYIKDCVLFEIQRSGGTTINTQKLLSGQLDPYTMISLAKNPAVFTKIWHSDGHMEDGVTCEDAGDYLTNVLHTELNLSNGTLAYEVVKAACMTAGYAADIGSLGRCRSLVEDILKKMSNQLGVTPPGIDYALHSYLLSRLLQRVVLEDSPNSALALIATSQTMSSFWGLGEHANSWIIVLKETLRAFAIAISPFVLLFAVTPIAGRALSVVLGLFIWVTCWGVVDAVIFTLGKTLAENYTSGLGEGMHFGWGTALAFSIPSYTTKIIATFGALRWSGLGLATIVTSLLVRFGGAMLAIVGEHIASLPMSAGRTYGTGLMRNPDTLITGEIVPKVSLSNAAMAMGGFRNYVSGVTNLQAGRMTGEARVGTSFLTHEIAGATAAGIGGGIAAWRMFDNAYSKTTFSQHGSLRERSFMWNVTGGNVGKLIEMDVGLRALKDERIGGTFLKPEEKKILESGTLSQKIAVFQTYKDTNFLNVKPFQGGYLVSAGDERAKWLVFYNPGTGVVETFDVRFPRGLNITTSDISNWEKNYALRHQGEILEESRKLLGGRFTDSMGRRIQSTYQREFSEHLRKNLEELANRNEEFQKFLRNFHVTTQQLTAELSLGISKRDPIQKILRKVLGAGGGVSFSERGVGEKGEKNIQTLAYQLRNVVTQSATEAAEATMSEMENAGYSVDAVREYMRNAGARHLATWTEMEQLRETVGTGATREINVDFLKFVARKEGIPEGKAFFEIAEDPQKFEEYKVEFLNEMSRNPDWMKKYYERKNELEGEIKGVQGQVDRGAAEAYEKARSFRPSTSHIDEMAKRFKTNYNLNPRDTWAYVEKERSKNLFLYGVGKVPFLGQLVKDVSTVAYNVAKGAIPPEPGEKLLRPDRNVIRGRIILPERRD